MLNKKVIEGSKHNLTLKNGSVFRKNGVAEKRIRAPMSSFAEQCPKPPKIEDVKHKLDMERHSKPNKTKPKTISQRRAKSRNWIMKTKQTDSESEIEPTMLPKKSDEEIWPSLRIRKTQL